MVLLRLASNVKQLLQPIRLWYIQCKSLIDIINNLRTQLLSSFKNHYRKNSNENFNRDAHFDLEDCQQVHQPTAQISTKHKVHEHPLGTFSDMTGEELVPVVIRLSIKVYQCENHPKYLSMTTMNLFLDKKIHQHVGLAMDKEINILIKDHQAM